MSDRNREPSQPIIFFDGVCGLCNRFVDQILRHDKQAIFRFAPLQGSSAKELLPAPPSDPQAWSLIYLDEVGSHQQSDASLQIYRRLGGFFWVLSLARIIPRFIRNPVYRLIARNRYRWFGKREVCRIPSPAERDRFLP